MADIFLGVIRKQIDMHTGQLIVHKDYVDDVLILQMRYFVEFFGVRDTTRPKLSVTKTGKLATPRPTKTSWWPGV